eukprot:s4126_g3.t1
MSQPGSPVSPQAPGGPGGGTAEQYFGQILQMMQKNMNRVNQESVARMEVVERSLRETTAALHEAQGRQAAELAKSLEGLTRRSTGVVDVKGVGKPDHLKGSHEEVKKVWKTWSYKMETWFCSQYPEVGQKVLDWAKLQGDAAIMESDIQTFAQSEKLKLEDVQGLDAHLHVALVSLTSDMAYDTVYNSRKKSGLDAWRRLSHVYEPLNPRSNMRLLRRILVQPRSTLESLRSAIDRWEADILEYTQRGNQDLSDVGKITVLMAMCPENLEDHLELNIGRLDTYAKMRSEVVSYTEQKYAKTDAESGGAAPMELDAFKGKGTKGKGGKGGKGKGQDKSKDKDIVCHLCQKKGHRKADCWHNPANGGSGKPQAKPKGQNDSKDKGAKGKGKKGKAHTLEGEEDQQWPAEEGAATEAGADGALGSLCVYSGSGGSRCVSHRSPALADAGDDDEFEEIEVEEEGEDPAPSYAAHHYVPPHRGGLSAKSAAKPRASRPQGFDPYDMETNAQPEKAVKFKPPEPKGPPPGYRPKPEVVAKEEQESEESSEEKGGAASSSMRAPSLKDDVKEEQSPGQEDKPKKYVPPHRRGGSEGAASSSKRAPSDLQPYKVNKASRAIMLQEMIAQSETSLRELQEALDDPTRDRAADEAEMASLEKVIAELKEEQRSFRHREREGHSERQERDKAAFGGRLAHLKEKSRKRAAKHRHASHNERARFKLSNQVRYAKRFLRPGQGRKQQTFPLAAPGGELAKDEGCRPLTHKERRALREEENEELPEVRQRIRSLPPSETKPRSAQQKASKRRRERRREARKKEAKKDKQQEPYGDGEGTGSLMSLAAQGPPKKDGYPWTRVNFVVDSGASATTIPLSLVGDHRRLDPAVGFEKFRLADGNTVQNKGCLKARAWLQGGETLLATMSVADIHQPLLSVSQLIEKGNTVVMHKDRAYVETASGIKHRVYLRGGVFMLPVWLDLSELGVEEESEGAMEQGELGVEEESEGAMEQGLAEAESGRPAKPMRSPQLPSPEEIEAHNVRDPEEIPVFSIDYGFFGAPGEIQESAVGGSKMPVLVGRDRQSKALFTHLGTHGQRREEATRGPRVAQACDLIREGLSREGVSHTEFCRARIVSELEKSEAGRKRLEQAKLKDLPRRAKAEAQMEPKAKVSEDSLVQEAQVPRKSRKGEPVGPGVRTVSVRAQDQQVDDGIFNDEMEVSQSEPSSGSRKRRSTDEPPDAMEVSPAEPALGRCIRVEVHGDDFTALAGKRELEWFANALSKEWTVEVRGYLGPPVMEGTQQSIDILNRLVSWTSRGIEVEADPRHAALIQREVMQLHRVCQGQHTLG